MISYFEEMFWEQIENGERMKKAILDEFKRQDLDILKDSKEKIIKVIDCVVSAGESNIHRQIFKLCQANLNGQLYTLFWFKKVASIPAGGSFGERALIKNEDRAATIICSEDCTFATLSRIDYNWIIGSAKRRELKQMAEMLK